MPPATEREFLIRLAPLYLACRLAVMGGCPMIPQHRPVRDFASLGWPLVGMIDYAAEMRLLISEERAAEVTPCRNGRQRSAQAKD